MSSSRTAGDVPGFGWLLGMSSWMLLTVVPGPALAWLGFGIVGSISRRPRVIILGVVAGALAFLASMELWGPWQPLVRSVVYLGGILAALAVNPRWLRTMWTRRTGRTAPRRDAEMTWHRAPSTTTAEPAPARTAAPRRRGRRKSPAKAPAAEETRAASLAREAGADTTDLLEPRASAPDASGATDASAEPAEPVDVNTADADALATLPGVSRTRARRAVRERTARGGFTSVEDFAETLGLQPHEIVRLRRAATCSPRPRGERRFGRRVDF
jgi:DNA uptake protein ComE-like DNA-binding protein